MIGSGTSKLMEHLQRLEKLLERIENGAAPWPMILVRGQAGEQLHFQATGQVRLGAVLGPFWFRRQWNAVVAQAGKEFRGASRCCCQAGLAIDGPHAERLEHAG